MKTTVSVNDPADEQLPDLDNEVASATRLECQRFSQ